MLSHSVVSDSATSWTVARQALSMRILQARILEWTAMPSSRGSSQPRDQTHVSYVSCTGRQVLYHWLHLESPVVLYYCIFQGIYCKILNVLLLFYVLFL